jgi:hypothetical protein
MERPYMTPLYLKIIAKITPPKFPAAPTVPERIPVVPCQYMKP